MQTAKDTRKYIRHEVIDFSIILPNTSKLPVSALIVDVGLGGVALRTREKFPPEEMVTITVGQNNGSPISFHGEIRYCDKREKESTYAVGVQFKPANQEERALIANFINNAFQRNSQPNLAV